MKTSQGLHNKVWFSQINAEMMKHSELSHRRCIHLIIFLNEIFNMFFSCILPKKWKRTKAWAQWVKTASTYTGKSQRVHPRQAGLGNRCPGETMARDQTPSLSWFFPSSDLGKSPPNPPLLWVCLRLLSTWPFLHLFPACWGSRRHLPCGLLRPSFLINKRGSVSRAKVTAQLQRSMRNHRNVLSAMTVLQQVVQKRW